MYIFETVLYALIPSIIYLIIIWLSVPYKTISLINSFWFLLAGFVSTGFLFIFTDLVPQWYNLHTISTDNMLKSLLYYFIQVALLEEFSKCFLYKIYDRIIQKKRYYHPTSIMIYCGMVGLGFAFAENIKYSLEFGSNILYMRAATAVILHMVASMLIGYWIALGRMNINLNPRTYIGILINKNQFYKRTFYTLKGIISATILHGLYNLNLYYYDNSSLVIQIMLLISGIILVNWCIKDLNNKYNKSKNYG